MLLAIPDTKLEMRAMLVPGEPARFGARRQRNRSVLSALRVILRAAGLADNSRRARTFI